MARQTVREQVIKTWRLDQLGWVQRCKMKGEPGTPAQMDSRKLPGTGREGKGVSRASGRKGGSEED